VSGTGNLDSAASAFAAGTSIAAEGCDIFGIRLGMSSAEVSDALKATMGLVAEIRPQLFLSDFGRSAYVGAIDYQYGYASIRVEFEELIPLELRKHIPLNVTHSQEVRRIEYKLENPTSVDQVGFRAATIAKFGTPTDIGPLLHWSRCPNLEAGLNYLVLSTFMAKKKSLDVIGKGK
jgi:hypothetical protein